MSEQELEDIMPLEDWLIAYKELQALRAWKEKARPFLPVAKSKLISCIEWAHDETHVNNLKENIQTLTELLGGDDEN